MKKAFATRKRARLLHQVVGGLHGRARSRQLARAHQALQDSTEVSEQRRRYLETILENVAAGNSKVFDPISDSITASYFFISSMVVGNFSPAS